MLITDLPLIPFSITGSEYIAVMQNGVTCKVPLSEAFGGGSISVTSSVIPATGNGIYLPSTNTVGIAAHGALGLAVTNPAFAVDYLQIQGSATASPVAYVSMSALGSDSHIGVNYNGKGTTTVGNQFNGLAASTTGTHNFYLNGVQTLLITDTYWNPNDIYSGPCDGGIVISSGTSSGGVETSGVLAAQIFNPATATSATLRLHAQGALGEIHFMTNGQIGVSVAAFTNPVGVNQFSTPNTMWLSGSATGSGQDCVIFTNFSSGGGDAATGLTFYIGGTGNFTFQADNASSSICKLLRTASAVNYVNIQGAATGVNPIVWASGPGGGERLTLAGADTAGVDICNGGQFNGAAACAFLARFSGGFEPADYFTFTAGATPTITTQSGDLKLAPAGSLSFGTFTGTPATSAGYISVKDSGGTVRKLMVGT